MDRGRGREGGGGQSGRKKLIPSGSTVIVCVLIKFSREATEKMRTSVDVQSDQYQPAPLQSGCFLTPPKAELGDGRVKTPAAKVPVRCVRRVLKEAAGR